MDYLQITSGLIIFATIIVQSFMYNSIHPISIASGNVARLMKCIENSFNRGLCITLIISLWVAWVVFIGMLLFTEGYVVIGCLFISYRLMCEKIPFLKKLTTVILTLTILIPWYSLLLGLI